jgi:hypothetical protein
MRFIVIPCFWINAARMNFKYECAVAELTRHLAVVRG